MSNSEEEFLKRFRKLPESSQLAFKSLLSEEGAILFLNFGGKEIPKPLASAIAEVKRIAADLDIRLAHCPFPQCPVFSVLDQDKNQEEV